MDISTLAPLLTGSGGAVVVLIMWVRSLNAQLERLQSHIDEETKAFKEIQKQSIQTISDVTHALQNLENHHPRTPPATE